jgi:hypothetical protein
LRELLIGEIAFLLPLSVAWGLGCNGDGDLGLRHGLLWSGPDRVIFTGVNHDGDISSGTNLSNSNLSDGNFFGVDFSDANLTQANAGFCCKTTTKTGKRYFIIPSSCGLMDAS